MVHALILQVHVSLSNLGRWDADLRECRCRALYSRSHAISPYINAGSVIGNCCSYHI